MRLARSLRAAAAALLTTLLLSPASAADGLLPKKAGAPVFLPVDQAFEVQPLEFKDGHLLVSWRITPGYYLYRDRLKFTAVPQASKVGAPVLPPSQTYKDEHFGDMQVYRDKLTVRIPVIGASPGPWTLSVAYQGCADAGLCYPPQTRTLEAAR
ncbi:MAG TPA: protein-disulfide reductase DsbD domain-containing protein [Verrucomicrobiae bacterium]|nr:protein-disulfide reductase DsbD domain-containing protein [Verrucomicrobiae bacterium]